ncbi:hypothetical protein L1887_05687 [Cichorium endivia]|nr:hypothetical protein L1887_05687 [Cichorium endivia]
MVAGLGTTEKGERYTEEIVGDEREIMKITLCRYVTLDAIHGKKLYYYFVLSERNPSKDPVVLWLNGGPGCSSFDGFVYEHGPFDFEKTKGLPKLHLNDYAWNKVSNMIFLDSPVGVGMSYSRNKADYNTTDTKTALDSHKFLLEWFKLYPEFVSNPFYIAGESFAGIYIPTLSYEVIKGLDAGQKPAINFKGYIIGNGVCDDVFDGNAIVPFVHGMGLISDELYEEVNKTCKGNYYKPPNKECESKLRKVDQDLDGLNMYNILEPCFHANGSINMDENTKLPMSFRKLGETRRRLPVRTRMFGRAWPFKAPVKPGYVPSWPELLKSSQNIPCTDDSVATRWLNDEAVRVAIHADPILLAGKWEICTDRIKYHQDTGSMIKYHKNLTARGYRALIFSGDHDMCVPFTGSEAWTRSLGYKVIDDEWRQWEVDEQVAGYLQAYDKNLTFLTIKGAGHTVPEYKPKEALAFYSRWLEGKKI